MTNVTTFHHDKLDPLCDSGFILALARHASRKAKAKAKPSGRGFSVYHVACEADAGHGVISDSSHHINIPTMTMIVHETTAAAWLGYVPFFSTLLY